MQSAVKTFCCHRLPCQDPIFWDLEFLVKGCRWAGVPARQVLRAGPGRAGPGLGIVFLSRARLALLNLLYLSLSLSLCKVEGIWRLR